MMEAPTNRQLAQLNKADIIEHYEVLGTNFDIISERLAELELQLEDLGWQQFSVEGDAEFSRSALGKIIRTARVMSIKNPLVNRAVEVPTYYVWGQGVSVSAKYKPLNAFVQALWDDDSNKAEFSSSEAQVLNEKELRTAGNLFFVLFPDTEIGLTEIRTFPVEECADIICNPQDRTEPWYYVRTWTDRVFNELSGSTQIKKRTAYYPDLRYWKKRGGDFPEMIGRKPVMPSPVRHVKVGGLKTMRFGVPEIYASLDWAQAAKADLEDYATIRRSLARYAWLMTMSKAGKTKADAAERKIGARIDNNTGQDSNPPKPPGATYIAGEGVSLQPMQTRGATPDPDGARRMWLMVASATGLPETFFGDADVGNHATSKTLDRPTELQFDLRRKLWTDVITEILQFATDVAILAHVGELEGEVGKDLFGREILVFPTDPESEDQTPYSRHIEVAFPDILEHDMAGTVGAIVDAMTLKGHPDAHILPAREMARQLLQVLGSDDIDELLEKVYDKDGNLLNPPPVPVVPGLPGQGNPQQLPGQRPTNGQVRAQPLAAANDILGLVEAVRELRSALQEIADRPEPVAA